MIWMIVLACMWSPSFLFVKLSVGEIPPLTLTACRVSLATLLFICLLVSLGRQMPRTLHFWKHAAVMAFFSSTLPFTLFCIAGMLIDTALAAIINGASPMFTLVLAQIFSPGSDRLSRAKVAGILVSIAGLLVLFYPSLKGDVDVSNVGMIAALMGAFVYGISHVYGKKFLSQYPPFVVPAAQMGFSSLYLWPVAFFVEAPINTLPYASWTAWTGVAGLAIMGSFCAFLIYYKLLRESGPTAVSAVACIFPVIAMFLGFIFLGESLSLHGIIATIMIFGGLFLVNEIVPSWARKKAPA